MEVYAGRFLGFGYYLKLEVSVGSLSWLQVGSQVGGVSVGSLSYGTCGFLNKWSSFGLPKVEVSVGSLSGL